MGMVVATIVKLNIRINRGSKKHTMAIKLSSSKRNKIKRSVYDKNPLW